MKRGLGMRMENLIGFQKKDDYFLVEYDKILDSIREKINKGWIPQEIARADFVTQIEKLSFDRFGTKIKLFTDSGFAACIPFFANDSNILLGEFWRKNEWLKSDAEVFDKPDTYKGSVDLATAKITGDYQKGISSFYMNYHMLMQPKFKGGVGLTNREVMAVHLHEQGHIFYPLAYSQELDYSNAILEDARKEILGAKKDKRDILLKTFQKLGVGNKEELVDNLTSSNPAAFTKGMLKVIGEATLQHQTSGKYANTNFEALADNFASRFGLGQELVTALEKLVPFGVRWNDLFRYIKSTLAFMRYIRRLTNTLILANILVKNLKAVPFLRGLIVGFMLFSDLVAVVFTGYWMLRTSGEAGKKYTYDDLVIRYTRIRQQMIQSIKSKELTKSDASVLISSVDMLGEIIKKGSNWRTPLDFLFNTLNPEDRRARDSVQRQQALEMMVNNDLFLGSLKLNQLS